MSAVTELSFTNGARPQDEKKERSGLQSACDELIDKGASSSTDRDARDAYSVVTVTLVDLHLQRRLRMSGIDADDGQPHSIQLGPQPRRRCSRLEVRPVRHAARAA